MTFGAVWPQVASVELYIKVQVMCLLTMILELAAWPLINRSHSICSGCETRHSRCHFDDWSCRYMGLVKIGAAVERLLQ